MTIRFRLAAAGALALAIVLPALAQEPPAATPAPQPPNVTTPETTQAETRPERRRESREERRARRCAERITRSTEGRVRRIERATNPNDQQRGAFDDLKNAYAKAGETLRSGCTRERMVSPLGRLEAMEKSLDLRLQAIRTMKPALEAYYKVLSEEQKARLSISSNMGNGSGRSGRRDGGRRGGRRGDRRRR